MERRRYYHFLLPKSDEEEQQKLYGDGPRPLSFRCGGYGPIELSSEQAFDYVLKHWDAGTVSRMISHGQEQIPIVVQDLESGFKHDIYLVRSTEGGGEEKYKIHLHWKQKNVRKQGDRDTLLIGIYWDIISSCLCLSVLDGPC
ncbi:hypothetical protein OIU77_018357 [Salix suchowensis]|uniref:Uncharacterized protein n=1 Tax=Salix suchowensis TaxID=1278906 RepID=A0ABQ9CC58_9ROSI|nr:hypothetical protein OIU77_018357 [Salix suchowensis]